MPRLDEVQGQELIWSQPHRGASIHELHAGEELVATLSRLKGSGSVFEAVSAVGSWTFRRTGLWHPRVVVRQRGSESDLATLSLNGRNSVLDAGATELNWKTEGLLHPSYAWYASGPTPLMRFKPTSAMLRMKGVVEMDAVTPTIPSRELLIALGWYLIVAPGADMTSGATVATMG